ncbi:cytochrome b [Gluconobacter roseus]|uniref:Cytochrome b n=1 Tax=Gluconobacter roseus NBRC 3990 TaxID=1307950 RepID=A0A4Y3M473_9PROT|nr:cytochrome b [Gluconobacter roseus]KXV44379.1 cytochrome B [Gluconobacter roseus]GEB03425.1 cytochrome b [Gluconobacter roseus NBRC 3990]GLP93883.1 cytochrome b [Gluconobacter roseus NBRC 3990]
MSCMASFPLLSRVLHWLMAIMILAMLFIGLFMASSVGPNYHRLVTLHRPLGIAILVLAILRLGNRLRSSVQPLPDDMPRLLRWAATASHLLLYGLMIALPLVGWGMLSAGGFPIPLWGQSVLLPSILPHNPVLWSWLRSAHSVLAFALFGLVLAHIGAALFHGLIRRDSVLRSMI